MTLYVFSANSVFGVFDIMLAPKTGENEIAGGICIQKKKTFGKEQHITRCRVALGKKEYRAGEIE